jgi:hypothetical protein
VPELEIDARTKVGALLDAYPELEEPLIERVPAFAKLKNPVLRASVAKFVSLEKAARVAGIPLPELLAFVHEKLGRKFGGAPSAAGASPGPVTSSTPPPWFDSAQVAEALDADALLAAGEHPLGAARKALARHPPGAVITIRSSFEPAPLIDQLAESGLLVACMPQGAGFLTALRKP